MNSGGEPFTGDGLFCFSGSGASSTVTSFKRSEQQNVSKFLVK